MTQTSSKTLLLYDADCGFCSWSVLWLQRLDRDQRIVVMPSQTPGILERYGISLENAQHSMHVVSSDGNVKRKGWALHAALEPLPWLWPACYLWRIPGFPALADWLYGRLAANRQHISKLLGLQACRLPQHPS